MGPNTSRECVHVLLLLTAEGACRVTGAWGADTERVLRAAVALLAAATRAILRVPETAVQSHFREPGNAAFLEDRTSARSTDREPLDRPRMLDVVDPASMFMSVSELTLGLRTSRQETADHR